MHEENVEEPVDGAALSGRVDRDFIAEEPQQRLVNVSRGDNRDFRHCRSDDLADLSVRFIRTNQHGRSPRGRVAPGAHALRHADADVVAARSCTHLSRVDDDKPCALGVICKTIGFRSAHDGDVPGCQCDLYPLSDQTCFAGQHGNESQWRAILNIDRPRGVHDDAQRKSPLRARAAEEMCESVHTSQTRRSRMYSSDSGIQNPAIDVLARAMTNSPVLVLGGTGRTGRRITERLRSRGVPTRAASRRSAHPFDWAQPSTWDAALSGVGTAYVCYSPDLAFPGVSDLMAQFADRARAHRVRRLVLLSGRGEQGARASERAIQQSGLDWTIVRSSWFAQNFSEHFLLGPVQRGRLVLPAGEVREPFVDLDDLADLAAAALTEEQHAGRLYEITGPRLLSMTDVAAELSAATGRQICYQSCTPAEFVADVTADGIPTPEAEPLADLFQEVLDGRNATLTEDLEMALGRPSTDFADYARRVAATGLWDERSAVHS